MRWTVLASLLLGAVIIASYVEAAPSRAPCEYGRVQAFAEIRDKPSELVGTIPSTFTNDPRYFQRRYNCEGSGVWVRRVDLGTYDLQLPGLGRRTPLVSAISQEGLTASVAEISLGVYRVVLRGPLVERSVLTRRDVAFSIAVF